MGSRVTKFCLRPTPCFRTGFVSGRLILPLFSFSYIPTANSRKFKQNEGQMYTLLKAIIDKRKEETEAGEAVKNDLLGILLDSNSKEIQQAAGKNNKNNQNVGMSLEEVIDECKLFYLAGQETTSTLLVWSMILLSKHQDWQQRAREEVLQIFGDKLPDFEGLSRLKTVSFSVTLAYH